MARNKYDVDEKLEAEFSLKHAKRLLLYLAPYRKTIIGIVLLMLISSVLELFGPYLLRIAIDKSIPLKDIRGLAILSSLLIILALLSTSISRNRIIKMSAIGQNVIAKIRLDVFKHLQELPFSYFDNRPHGKILVRVVNYVNALSDLLSNGVINLITDIFSLLVIIVFMFVLNYKLALVAMAPLPIFIFCVFLLKTKHRKAWRDYSAKNSNINAYTHESITGMKVTQAFAREETNTNIFKQLIEDSKCHWMKAQHIEVWIAPMVDNASVLAMSLLYLCGVLWISDGNISIGVLIQFTSYVAMFWNPVVNLANFYNQITTAMAYLERVIELLDEPVNVHDTPDAYELPDIIGNVTFENVSFSYDANKLILKNINFEIGHGETVALVGPTGAGKTTIINLISRFYNLDKGKVYVDGHDIGHVTLNSLRKQMGVMLQDTFIFSGTIMDNIRYGNMQATVEDVEAAAKAVCAHDFIMSLTDGYDTEVNERGSRLSVGQRQLISFARALLANPKILILDEATSSIDTETEILLQQGLEELLTGRTSFIIAHRLSTIRKANRIMYIDKGKIIEQGTHEQLMESQGAYYRLYTAQYAFLEQI
ncbi:MAG: ABC transporter ATP-binding protein [Hyphomonadaceae bacterium]|nr:ABC transporter ATP-binding protein [Clostridia bacterium]